MTSLIPPKAKDVAAEISCIMTDVSGMLPKVNDLWRKIEELQNFLSGGEAGEGEGGDDEGEGNQEGEGGWELPDFGELWEKLKQFERIIEKLRRLLGEVERLHEEVTAVRTKIDGLRAKF